MKKLKNFTVGCGLFLSLLMLFNKTNATAQTPYKFDTKLKFGMRSQEVFEAQFLQEFKEDRDYAQELLYQLKKKAGTQKPDLNLVTPIVGGLVVKYQVNTDTRDTVWSRIEIAATAAFLNPQVFWVRMSDTITSYSDTLTEAMGLAPAPAGYFIRIWTVSLNRNDSVVSITDYGTTLEPVSNCWMNIIQTIPHESGCYIYMNLFSGNTIEKMTITKKYSYDSINFFPAGSSIFTGKQSNVVDSLTGLFANKKVYLRMTPSNSKNSRDTTISFVTTLVATKAIVEVIELTPETTQVKVKVKCAFGFPSVS